MCVIIVISYNSSFSTIACCSITNVKCQFLTHWFTLHAIPNNYEILLFWYPIIQLNIVVAVESQVHTSRIIAFLSRERADNSKRVIYMIPFESICWEIIQLRKLFDRKITKLKRENDNVCNNLSYKRISMVQFPDYVTKEYINYKNKLNKQSK